MTGRRTAWGRERDIGEGGRCRSKADGGWGREGRENTGKLVGDVTEYGTGCRRRGWRGGRGGGANPFRDVQHPKRRFGFGVKRDGAGQYGCRSFPRDEVD